MSKFQLVLRCRSCKHKYKRIVAADSEEDVADIPDPPCPKCAKKTRRTDVMETASAPIPFTGFDPTRGTAPGIIGGNKMVKAIDKTAEIVMQDHHLSDLKTNVREGDIMAPSLPPQQQKLADNFFGPQNKTMANKRQQAKMGQMLRRAVGGAYRASALDVKSVLPDDRVKMRKVGVEQINR